MAQKKKEKLAQKRKEGIDPGIAGYGKISVVVEGDAYPAFAGAGCQPAAVGIAQGANGGVRPQADIDAGIASHDNRAGGIAGYPDSAFTGARGQFPATLIEHLGKRIGIP